MLSRMCKTKRFIKKSKFKAHGKIPIIKLNRSTQYSNKI